jgi:hypothetical protein
VSKGALATQSLAMDVVWPGGLLTSPMQDEQQATGSADAQGRQTAERGKTYPVPRTHQPPHWSEKRKGLSWEGLGFSLWRLGRHFVGMLGRIRRTSLVAVSTCAHEGSVLAAFTCVLVAALTSVDLCGTCVRPFL